MTNPRGMRKSERYPGIIVSHKQFAFRVDFDPRNGEPKGVMVYRPGKASQEIDHDLTELSRLASRALQKRDLPE